MERCMQEIGTVHKQGWLSKAPPITHLNNSGKVWKKRFFVILQIDAEKESLFRNSSKKDSVDVNELHDFYLVYWESDIERKKVGSQSLSAIPLLGHYHAHKYLSYEQKYQNVVLLVTDNRVYFFSAENEEEMHSWFYHLNKALSWVRGKCSETKEYDPDLSLDEKSVISDNYCERVDLPPVPRESWTMPKRFDPLLDSDNDISSSSNDLSDDPSYRPVSPRSKSTLLKRTSFGSVHGYYTHERSHSGLSSSSIANEMECLGVGRSAYKRDRRRRTPLHSASFHCHKTRNGYVENPTPTIEEKEATNKNTERESAKKTDAGALSPLSIFPPPPLEALLGELPLESSNVDCDKPKIEKNENTKKEATRGKHLYTYSNHELYKFSKGPDSATLHLFESPVVLPSNTTTNITSDGLQIKYGDHEILIRRLTKLSDDIIEV